MLFEATHPSGIVVKIVGIAKGDHGRLCEEHDVCVLSVFASLGGKKMNIFN